MKTSLKSLFAIAALGLTSLALQAQPAPKIVLFDLNKIVEGYYRTEEEKTKLQADQQKAQAQLEGLNKELNALAEQYKETVESTKNPALTSEARSKAESDAQLKGTEAGKKQQEIRNFQQTVLNSFQQRQRNYLETVFDEASKIAVDMGKKKGANLVIEKSGASGIGIAPIVYSDPGFDITDDVLAEMNKNRPAPAATTTAPAAGGDAPAVSFPSSKK